MRTIALVVILLAVVSAVRISGTDSPAERLEDRVTAMLIADDLVSKGVRPSDVEVVRAGGGWTLVDRRPYAPLVGGELRLVRRSEDVASWQCVNVPIGCRSGSIDVAIAQRAEDRHAAWLISSERRDRLRAR